MGKIIYLDGLTGTQHVKSKYSNKLMWELKDFFAKHDEGYYNEREKEGILCKCFRLGNNICIKSDIIVRQNDFLCDTELAPIIKNLSRGEELKLLRKINEINNKLDYGYFALAKRYGDVIVIYKTYFEPEEGIDCFDGLDKLIGYPMGMIEQYGVSILACVGIEVSV